MAYVGFDIIKEIKSTNIIRLSREVAPWYLEGADITSLSSNSIIQMDIYDGTKLKNSINGSLSVEKTFGNINKTAAKFTIGAKANPYDYLSGDPLGQNQYIIPDSNIEGGYGLFTSNYSKAFFLNIIKID